MFFIAIATPCLRDTALKHWSYRFLCIARWHSTPLSRRHCLSDLCFTRGGDATVAKAAYSTLEYSAQASTKADMSRFKRQLKKASDLLAYWVLAREDLSRSAIYKHRRPPQQSTVCDTCHDCTVNIEYSIWCIVCELQNYSPAFQYHLPPLIRKQEE
jgi:hypothetical protein